MVQVMEDRLLAFLHVTPHLNTPKGDKQEITIMTLKGCQSLQLSLASWKSR